MSTVKTPSASSARLADRYIRCEDFADRIDGIELAPEVWAVFAQLAQSRNATELAQHLQLDIEAVNASLRRLVRRKLIRKHVLGWRDYTATHAPFSATPSGFEGSIPPFRESASAQTAAAPTLTVIAPPSAAHSRPPFLTAVAAQIPTPALPRSPILSFRITSPAPARAQPAVSLRIESSRPTTSAPGIGSTNTSGLKLRPILDAIGAKAGGGVAGQLLVYRVFLQIPTELMQAAGLHSLSLVDDQFTLHAPLRTALAEAARVHADIDIETLVSA
ncbi:hypothetical protein [Rariglobus hedericola]|uniref:Uncharacterized protein n=1 Tax=Rariglobus hedericola TaxID=2597822 RepID=A0A556QIZ3_9BACT|nr:hypothetical protein [Rariglobus hedericola]TSJ76597.1 hypothetical protein FPL22_10730 [Rariglobus hedericola]